MNTLFCFICLTLSSCVVYRGMHVRNYADIERKKNTMKTKILNKYKHSRGTVCVARQVDGEWVALAIDYPTWAIYSGAFSIL